MNYLRHLIASKGRGNLLRRFLQISRNFGFTTEKSRAALQEIVTITERYHCKPTAFVTADLLDHHADVIKRMCNGSVVVGLHGHHHVDHSLLQCEAQYHQIAEGLLKFQRIGIVVSGFRAPFLRFNEDTNKAVKDNNLKWVSHTAVFHRELMDGHKCSRSGGARNVIDSFYTCKSNDELPSVPWWGSHCLEIPVSLPDDEILVDRRGLRDKNEITRIMLRMVEKNRRNGELANILLHPERIGLFAPALEAVLAKATGHGDVWIGSLDDISEWWHARANCSFVISKEGPDCHRVMIKGDDRASAVLQKPGGAMEHVSREKDGGLFLNSGIRPTVCVLPGFCDRGAQCLRNEGYVVDDTLDPEGCSVTLNGTCPKDRRKLLESLTHGRGPLLRFWRWPDRYSSAMTISIDVDAITLWDFVRRARHFLTIDARE